MHSFEKKSRLHIALCALSLLAACASDPIGEEAPQPVGEPSQETAATGRLRVKFKQGEVPERIIETRSGLQTGSEPLDRAIAALGVTRMQRVFPPAGRFEARTRRAGLDRWYDVWFDSLRSVTRATLDLSRLEGIECVEPVYAIRSIGPERAVAAPLPAATRTASLPFDDPGLAKQWHYSNDGSMPDAVAGADINLFRAWEVTAGSNDVVVAVVDGGIDYAHEDLIGNVGNWAELYGEEGVDDDGNGYVDDIYGWNFIYSSAYPMGSNRITPVEHGTHVAGTIAAENGNGIGVCGVAGGRGGHSGVRVISCQMFTENRNDNGDEIVALKYGADAGAVISQNSWGYTNVYEMPEITKDAIDYFIEYAGLDENGVQVGPMKGGIVIFAAGNEECDYRSYPACYERVLSVSALAPDYRKSYYSNFSEWIDVAAPGGSYKYEGRYGDEYAVYQHPSGQRLRLHAGDVDGLSPRFGHRGAGRGEIRRSRVHARQVAFLSGKGRARGGQLQSRLRRTAGFGTRGRLSGRVDGQGHRSRSRCRSAAQRHGGRGRTDVERSGRRR